MASLFKTIDNIATKVSDKLNKDKWDKNAINPALFQDANENQKEEKEKEERREALQAQIKAIGTGQPIPPMPPKKETPAASPVSNGNKPGIPVPPQNVTMLNHKGAYNTAKVPEQNGANLVSLSDLPVVDPSQSISNIGNDIKPNILKPEGDKKEEKIPQAAKEQTPTAQAEAPQPAGNAATIVPKYTPKKKILLSSEGKDITKEEKKENIKAEGSKANDIYPNFCYYVLVKHMSDYPKPGSCVMIRSCDSQYAWTNRIGNEEKPAFDKCPVCGKPVSYTETEMD